jgi:hypothetical protein
MIGLIVLAGFGVAVGVRMGGGARKTSAAGILASRTPLQIAMKEMDDARERIHIMLQRADLTDHDTYRLRTDIAAGAAAIARFAEDATAEIPRTGDPRKDTTWPKRLEAVIADAEDFATIARIQDSDLRQMPKLFKAMTVKCTRCHEDFRSY